MSKRQRGKGRGPGAPAGQAPRGPQQGGGQQQQGGWAPVRDSVRRDVSQALAALAFAERLSERLDNQRRLYQDFPRVMEGLRSGALERLATALTRLYEDGRGQVVDVQRFLRDLPLALAQLAAAEGRRDKPGAQKGAPATATATAGAAGTGGAEGPTAIDAAASSPAGDIATPSAGSAGAESDVSAAAEAPAAQGEAATSSAAEGTGTGAGEATAGAEGQGAQGSTPAQPQGESPAQGATPSQDAAPAQDGAPAKAAVSPRVELRQRLLAAAPQLAKAAVTYRRNVATVRRACAPRRAPGPWRSDREVLDEARRAVEFVRQMFDTYAEAWADQPLEKDLDKSCAAEVDRFLAWTQLDRYAELSAPGQKTRAPSADKGGAGGEKAAAGKPAGDKPGSDGQEGAEAEAKESAGADAQGTSAESPSGAQPASGDSAASEQPEAAPSDASPAATAGES